MDVLIIEDDTTVSRMISEVLRHSGLQTLTCQNSREAVEAFRKIPHIGAVVVDLGLPDGDGLEIMRRTRQVIPKLPFFILTADHTVESAVMGMKAGALDYFTKPFDPAKLISAVRAAVHERQHVTEPTSDELVPRRWKSQRMRQVVEIARRAAVTRFPVFLSGPENTGKREIARKIHFSGALKNKPFHTIDAAAVSTEALEVQLFGKLPILDGDHPNSFHPATNHQCTIHIRNCEKLPPEAQTRLAGWLRSEANSTSESAVGVRLITSSSENLPKAIIDGTFNEDLWYSLATHHIDVPGLAERIEDLPLLCEEIITKLCVSRKITRPSLTRKAIEAILDHTWPGNLTELEHVLSHAVAHTTDRLIHKDDLPSFLIPEEGPLYSPSLGITSIEELNKASLVAALQACGGNRRRTAKRLKVSLRTVYNMIRRHGLADVSFRQTSSPDSP